MRLPNWTTVEAAGRWAAELNRTLTAALAALESRKQTRGEVLYLKAFEVANLPDPSPADQVIVVSDEVGGRTIALSDGTDWRRVTDRAVVS